MNKIETLKKNYEFKNVIGNGRYYIENQIIVYITKNKTKHNYIGIAINTKLCHAFKRNKLKRLIRENYRILQQDIKTGNNIVFLWNKKTDPDTANFNTIKIDMLSAFKSANIIINEEFN